MAAGADETELDRALKHPVRTDIIRLLWHLGDSATPAELRGDLSSEETPQTIVYHCRVLERAGVIEVDGNSDPLRPAYWIGGENADDAVRELGLWR